MSTATQDTTPTDAEVYEEQRRVFRVHAFVAAGSIVLIFLVNLLTNLAAGLTGWSVWWSAWALIGWGLAIGVHGLVLHLSRPEGAGAAA